MHRLVKLNHNSTPLTGCTTKAALARLSGPADGCIPLAGQAVSLIQLLDPPFAGKTAALQEPEPACYRAFERRLVTKLGRVVADIGQDKRTLFTVGGRARRRVGPACAALTLVLFGAPA